MAIYHLHVKNHGRRSGTSIVAAAAYRAGETLPNEAEEKESAFGGRRDVVFTEIRAPAGAPAWMSERAPLWNAVEAAEKRKDSRLAKEIEVAIPRELPRTAWPVLARAMADAYVSLGHVVDLAIHDDGTLRNPHIHFLLTTRLVGPGGFGGKLRDADGKAFVKEARARWETLANAALSAAGVDATIDARSYAARGIEREPGQHQRPDPTARRTRREERQMVGLDHDMLEARRELLAEETIRERFPQLAARPDWPPEDRSPPGGLSIGERMEFRRFWDEVNRRALGEPERELGDAEPDRPWEHDVDLERGEADRPARDVVRDVYAKVRDAELLQGEERRKAFAAAAPAYADLYQRLNRDMVAAGILKPGDVREWEAVSRAFRDPEFDRLLAEARAREAANRDPGRPYQPTRRDWETIERADRDEFERGSVAFEPNRERQPEPDPDGRVISRADLDRAEEAMIRDVEGRATHAARARQASPEDREQARNAIERQAAIEVPDREAHAYRLAPHEERLDWLVAKRPPRQESRHEPPAPARELPDRLDFLGPVPRNPDRDRDRDQERERER